MAGDPPVDLSGARVLVTRPAQQAAALCRLLERAGATALQLPLFEIVAAAPDALLGAQLSAVMGAHWWLFTSANAAHIATALSPPPWRPAVAAVGAATAAALRGAGVSQVLLPESHYSGAALLELKPFADPQGLRCVIITGEDGRSELADTLEARGAQVDTLALYRRQVIAHPADRVMAQVHASDVIVLTSAGGAQRLIDLTPERSREVLFHKPLLVPSPRVAEKVRESGFTVPPLLPQQIADTAMVDALADWWRTRKSAP